MTAAMRYFDWNATTPLWPEVGELLATRAREMVGNPSSVHQAGRAARLRLQGARESVARLLGCEPREVTFTGSGSDGAALAIKGAWLGRKDGSRRRVVTSSVEHPCVLGAVDQLAALGAEVLKLPVDAHGAVSLETLQAALTPETALCSLMWANNETGVLQPVAAAADLCHARGITFHTDAVQAAGKLRATLIDVHADALSLSAHKFGGPQGVGVLIARRGVNVVPLVPGHQEDGKRGGTQAVTQIEALARAFELSVDHAEAEGARLTSLRERLEREVTARVQGVVVNGAGAERLPNTSNLRFDGADGEALLIALDLEGFPVSSGAACASGSLKPSHVLTAMGLSPVQAQASLRFSMGRTTSASDVDLLVEALVRLVPEARRGL